MRRLSKHLQWIVLAGLILFVTSVLAVAINSLKYGFHIDYTISRYVGLETWSASVWFGQCNGGLFKRPVFDVDTGERQSAEVVNAYTCGDFCGRVIRFIGMSDGIF